MRAHIGTPARARAMPGASEPSRERVARDRARDARRDEDVAAGRFVRANRWIAFDFAAFPVRARLSSAATRSIARARFVCLVARSR